MIPIANRNIAPANPEDPRPAVFARGAVPIPNWFFDELMRQVSQRYIAVLLVVCRHTIGRQHRRNHIAMSQICKGARVSKDTARAALRFWVQAGLLRCTGRDGLRGTREWEVLLEVDPVVVLQRLAGPGEPVVRTSRATPTGGKALPSPGEPVAPLHIERQIETDRAEPLDSKAEDRFARMTKEKIEDNIARMKRSLLNPSLPPGEPPRIRAAIAVAEAELTRRHSSGPQQP